jgi:hypothetical protein
MDRLQSSTPSMRSMVAECPGLLVNEATERRGASGLVDLLGIGLSHRPRLVPRGVTYDGTGYLSVRGRPTIERRAGR